MFPAYDKIISSQLEFIFLLKAWAFKVAGDKTTAHTFNKQNVIVC